MKTYNKLVRDFIPSIIIQNGSQPVFKRLLEDPEEHLAAIRIKLQEELNELLEATSPDKILEEVADLCQVIEAFMIYHQIDEDTLYDQKETKEAERGSFNDAIYLIGIE